jgi:hypothetical protein
MRLIRKNSLVALLVVPLVGTPPLGRPPAHGSTGQPPVFQVAVLPESARVRRTSRFASVRKMRWWFLRRHRQPRSTIEARRQSLYSPLPLCDSYARGPPWSANLASR